MSQQGPRRMTQIPAASGQEKFLASKYRTTDSSGDDCCVCGNMSDVSNSTLSLL